MLTLYVFCTKCKYTTFIQTIKYEYLCVNCNRKQNNTTRSVINVKMTKILIENRGKSKLIMEIPFVNHP